MRLRQTADQLIPELAYYQQRFLIAGAAGAAVSLVGWFMNPAQFFQSYLMAYMLVLGATLGCLALGMIHQLSGGAWGVVTRRLIGAASRVLPVVTAALPADRRRHAAPLRVDARRRGRRRRAAAAQGGLPEHAVLPGARRDLLPGLERVVVLPQQVVGRPGPDRRPARPAAHAGAERRRAARLRIHHHLRVVRLADVARPALVLDHLRSARDRRAGADGDGGAHHRSRLVEPAASRSRRWSSRRIFTISRT